jgi:putative ABC transport system permease protein
MLLTDIRLALRMIGKSPGFSIVAVLTLAIGIGANTAIFSFVDAVLLRPLPYPHAERIVNLWETSPGGGRNAVSTMTFLDWKRRNTVFASIAAIAGTSYTLTGIDAPVQLHGSRVSAAYFDVMGIPAAMGRTFQPGEDEPGAADVAVLSHRVWESRFGSDRRIVGRNIKLDGRPCMVIGIMPADTPFDRGWTEIWTPLAFEPRDRNRTVRWMFVRGRLKPGISLEQAGGQMKSIAAGIEHDSPASNRGWSASVSGFDEGVTPASMRRSLMVLLAAVAAVLLMACANLASVLLVRGTSRGREVSIRSALGANRRRLFAQFLSESLVLALIGGALGLALGAALMTALKAALPPLTLPAEASVHLDVRVLAFTAAVVLLTALLFGIAPAVHSTRVEHSEALKETSRGATAGPAKQRLRGALVVAEVALAFILLSGALLLIRSFSCLLQTDPGFQSTNVVTMRLPMAARQYPDAARIVSYQSSVMEQIGAVPGVLDVATTSALPLQGWGWGMPFMIEGRPIDRAARPTCFFKMVAPAYFRALGMKVRQGRALAETDTAGSVRAVVVNSSFAGKYFGGVPPVGQRLIMPRIAPGQHESGPDEPWEIVGVVADEKVNGLDDSSPGMYVSYRQSPSPGVALVVRGAMDPARLIKPIQQAVWRVNRNQALYDVETLEQIRSESLGENRLRTSLLGVFAAIALLLASIGIYGVISSSVLQRTHEIGVRAALGAGTWDQLRLVLGGGVSLAALGLIIGLTGSLAATHLLSGLLFGVKEHDPLTLAVVTLLLGAVALAACCVPAWRATRINPMEALRDE